MHQGHRPFLAAGDRLKAQSLRLPWGDWSKESLRDSTLALLLVLLGASTRPIAVRPVPMRVAIA